MPRPLKVFKTHIGFYDMIVAAPSMKAAADAWHASPRLFAQGFAAPTHEAEAVEAALQHPGLVLKRPHGRHVPYKSQPDQPAAPRVTAAQKQKARKEKTRRDEAEKRARAAAEKKAKDAARDELAELARQEAALRQRRQALRKKLH